MRVRKKGRRASAVGTKDEKRGNVVCKYSRLKKRINKHKERPLVQSAAAFTLGLILSFLCFYILTFERGLDVRLAVGVSCSLAVVLSLGMAFSGMFRCLVTLVFPSFLTSEGRLVMLTYATILLVCGPLRNIEQNFENTSASLSCGAEVALNQTREIMQRAAAPLLSAVAQLKAIGEKLKDICDKAQSIFRTFGAAVQSVATAIKNVIDWIMNMGERCNDFFESPFKTCTSNLDTAYTDCRNRLSLIIRWLCEIVKSVRWICNITKVGKIMCLIPSKIKEFLNVKIAAPIEKHLQKLKRQFEFNITIDHKFTLNRESSVSVEQVAFKILEDIRHRMETLKIFFSFIGDIYFIGPLYLFLKCVWYRHKYLNRDNFDNCYITSKFVKVDETRSRLKKAPLLPLNTSEKSRYIKIFSPFLTPLEKRRLLLRMLYWLAFFLFTVFIIMIDYSTYWMLAKMQHFLQGDIVAQTPTQIAIKVHGTGVISDIYREMVKSYDTLQKTRFTIISIKCSPIPSPVDLNSYYIIGLIYGIALFMNIFEAYGLRFRRAICAKYYPEREQHRIMFLYNEILTQRHGVLKQMWRTIRRKGKYGGHTNFLQILATRILFLRPLVAFMGTTTQYCLACGASATRANINTFHNCIKPGCKGFYCSDCFGKLGSKCTLCLNPLDYGDESGFSEVVDSSDEELCRRVKVDAKNMDHQSGRPSSESESYDLSESEVKFAYQKTSHYSSEVRNHDACPLQPSKHKYEDLLKESDVVSGPSGPESDLEATDNEDEKTESEESEEDEEDGKVKSVEMES